jgi:hypothetical protein
MSVFVRQTNANLLVITKDLGEIKGALGVKQPDDTGKFYNKLNEHERYDNIERMRTERNTNKIGYKMLYLIIGILSSGFLSLLVHYLNK